MSDAQQEPAETAVGSGDRGRDIDMAAMHYRATGNVTGVVCNREHDPAKFYHVDLSEPSCTCDDFYFRHREDAQTDREADHTVCKHVEKAMLAHPDFTETPELRSRDLDAIVDRAARATREMERMKDNLIEVVRANAAPLREPQGGAESDGTPPAIEDVPSDEEAAERLQAAFDDAAEGMDVESGHGFVWINKTPEAPDWTFNAWIKDNDHAEYVHDDHDLADKKPGPYHQNAIPAEDVDAYISEVLG